MISHAMEDYLKAIYLVGREDGKVSTSRLAENLGCSAASVTNMLQRLASLKLVQYRPYQGVNLTDAGARVALEVIRHHRLIELYLKEVLGYSWDRVHAEAELLEHVMSEELEERMDKALGYPTRDPHGHPIPGKDGTMADERLPSLWEVQELTDVIVARVDDRDASVLRHLDSLGIHPEVEIQVLQKAPFNGPVLITLDSAEHSLSEELARQIFVRVR